MDDPTQDQLEASDKVEKRTSTFHATHEQLRRDAMIGGIV